MDFLYWKYDWFDLDKLGNDYCKVEFWFCKNDIFKFVEYFWLLDEIVIYNGLVVGLIFVLCIYFKYFMYFCCYGDMVFYFVIFVLDVFIIINYMIDWIYSRWYYLFLRYNYDLFFLVNFMLYVDVIYWLGVVLEKCCGFIDGIV